MNNWQDDFVFLDEFLESCNNESTRDDNTLSFASHWKADDHPVYHGATITVSQALEKHFEWFTDHSRCSKESLSKLLKMKHESILPQGNILCSSYQSAFKLIELLLLKPCVYDVCPNVSIVYWVDYEILMFGPKCGSARYLTKQNSCKNNLYISHLVQK